MRQALMAVAASSVMCGCELFVPLAGYAGPPLDASVGPIGDAEDGPTPRVDASRDGDAASSSDVGAQGDVASERLTDDAERRESSPLDDGAHDAQPPLDERSPVRDATNELATVDAGSVDAANRDVTSRDAMAAPDAGPESSTVDAAALVSGCSDGAREAFSNTATFPAIAGCGAQWSASSLRAPSTGVLCGNTVGPCAVPADACARGWHVCAVPPYGGADVSSKVTATQCLSQMGEYAAAIGDQLCEPCSASGSGAACCGAACVQQNGSCIFPLQTAWFGVIGNHLNLCSDIVSSGLNQGVLCCRNP